MTELTEVQLKERIVWLRRLMWANDATEKAVGDICDALEDRMLGSKEIESVTRWLRGHPEAGDSAIVENVLQRLIPDGPLEHQLIKVINMGSFGQGVEFTCSCGATISNPIYPHNAFYAMGQHLDLIPPTKFGESNE